MTAHRDWELWSTECRLVVTDPAALEEATALVDAELAAVEVACSRFRPDSELMTLRPDDEGWVTLSPLLAELVRVGLDAARETDGLVDPTLGLALSGLGYDRDIALLRRGGAPVRVVRRPVGWRSLTLEGDRLRLPAGTQLDLGATAKAHAADRCAALVDDRLGTGVLISLGGDIATAGPAPDGGWQVLVQDLPDDVPQQVTLAAGAAVATSSNARRTWRQGDEVRHHLVDPTTGLSARSEWRSVTVVASSCVRANTATTAALVAADGLAHLRTTGLPARVVPHVGRVVTLGGWPREEQAA